MAKVGKEVFIEADDGAYGTRQEKVTFPSNSHRSKLEESKGERRVEKVVSGRVVKQKKTLGKKFSESFFGDESRNVVDFVIHDVLIHAAKTMICDMVGWGGAAEMFLFGEKNGRRTTKRNDGRNNYTSYGSYFDDQRNGRREISRTARSRHDFDEILLETRGEAEEVLSHLTDLCIDYGMASVSDLYDLVGVTSSFTDTKYGWTDLRDIRPPVRVRNGYRLELPKPVPLD